jgi:hypothetical protein
MTYSFLELFYDGSSWAVRDYVTGDVHVFDEETKAGARDTTVDTAFSGTTHWIGSGVSTPVGCLVRKKDGKEQDFIINQPRFTELIRDKMGAGTLGSYNLRRDETAWSVLFVPYESYIGSGEVVIMGNHDKKSAARSKAEELMINQSEGIAVVGWDWYGEKITGFETTAFLWDWIQDMNYEV